MKKRILPFKLLLIFILLGGTLFSFLSFNERHKNAKSDQESKRLPNEIKPATEFLSLIRNNQETGLITPADLKKVDEELGNVPSSRALNLEWKQLGPDNMGGRTRAILFDKVSEDATNIYAAGVSGGIFKSENLGTTWKKVNSDSYNLFVTCMTQTPNGDIFAGTGESFEAQKISGQEEMGYTSGFMGTGIYKSTDGKNFSLLQSTKPDFNNMESDWAFINELASDQGNGRIYAATNTGLKYSNDGGDTWQTAMDTAGTELNSFAWDVQVGSDGSVITCVDNLAYLSINGNVNNFVLRSTGDSVSLPDADVARIKFAIAPSDPSVIYASVVNNAGNVKNIYRSEDNGVTWRIILPGTPSVNIFNKQGVFDNAITVFPDNPDKVLIGGIDMWQGEMYQEQGYFEWKSVSQSLVGPLSPSYVHEDHHVYKFFPGSNNKFMVGTDGGVYLGKLESNTYSFQTSNRNYFTTQHYAVGISGLKDYVIGGAQDIGTVKITGKGNTKLQGEQIFSGEGGPSAISVIDPNIIVVSSVDGIFRRSNDGGVNYSVLDQFPGTTISNPAFRTPMILSENFNNTFSTDSVWYHAIDTIPGGTTIQVRSHNAEQPFYYTTPNDTKLYPGDSIQVQDIVTCYYYVGVANNIWFTKDLLQFDKTAEWFKISNNDFGMQGIPYSLALSDDGNQLFVGTLHGKLYRISNLIKATTFELADISSPACIVATQPIQLLVPGTSDEVSQVVTSISINSTDPNKVMVTLGNYGNDYYVLYSTNALDQFPQFNSRQGNLPHMPVYSSVLEMSNSQIAILGTEHGIFTTENINTDSPTWSKQQTDMGSVAVFDLKQQHISQPPMQIKLVNGNEITYINYPGTSNWGSIYAATYGRGLFRCDNFYLVGIDDNKVTESNNLPLKVYPNPAREFTTVELNSERNKTVDLLVYDLTGRRVRFQKHQLIKGINKVRIDLSGLKKGTYILQAIGNEESHSSKFVIN